MKPEIGDPWPARGRLLLAPVPDRLRLVRCGSAPAKSCCVPMHARGTQLLHSRASLKTADPRPKDSPRCYSAARELTAVLQLLQDHLHLEPADLLHGALVEGASRVRSDPAEWRNPCLARAHFPTFIATNATRAIPATTNMTPALKIAPIASHPDVIAPTTTVARTGRTRRADIEVLIRPWQTL
jgi:hypothetical protein